MDFADLTKDSKKTRSKIYRFILTDHEAVRELLRHLTADQADQMLSLLISADDARIRAAHDQASKRKAAEIDALLS